MDLKLAEVSPHERYKLLIGLVIPRPIAWISTRSANGVANCDIDLAANLKKTMFNFAAHRRPEHYRLIVERVGAEVTPAN